jgi:cytochrome c oxidase cbb3-type subunit 2
MNRGYLLYTGVLFTVLISFTGLVFIPNLQLVTLEPVTINGVEYPREPRGPVAAGRDVYVAMGCVYCHSQQVRPDGFGADIARGWGTRRTVARDYIYDQPHLLGTMRTGPDLANIGVRQPSDRWHYLHLFNPRITSPGSNMAPFPFLFEIGEHGDAEPPEDAIVPPEGFLEEGKHIIPTERARNLVAYLKSLDSTYDVPEAP